MPLGLTDYDGALDWIDDMVAARQRGYVCVCNVHAVMASAEDPQLRSALLGSSLNVPDGQPLVWALNLLGHVARHRVYGPELMARYCARARRPGQRMYLYGGRNQGALVQLALNLRQRYPGVRIVGGYSPPHRRSPPRSARPVVKEINGSRADVVWVGIGVPKQEKWMAEMRDEPRDAGAHRRRRRVRLPRRPRPPGAEPGCRSPAWSGPTDSPTSPGACGGATRATTRASSARSRASCASIAAPPHPADRAQTAPPHCRDGGPGQNLRTWTCPPHRQPPS